MALKGYINPTRLTIIQATKQFVDGTLVYVNAQELTSIQFSNDGQLLSLNHIPLDDIITISIFKD